MENIILEIPIDPVAKGRPRFSTLHGKIRAITPKTTRTFEQILRAYSSDFMKRNNKSVLSGALFVKLIFTLRRPKSVKRFHPTTKPDTDNFCKGTLDSLNGIFWEDDSQIVTIEASKRYGASYEEPSIYIEVHELMTAEENGHKKNTIRGKGAKCHTK